MEIRHATRGHNPSYVRIREVELDADLTDRNAFDRWRHAENLP